MNQLYCVLRYVRAIDFFYFFFIHSRGHHMNKWSSKTKEKVVCNMHFYGNAIMMGLIISLLIPACIRQWFPTTVRDHQVERDLISLTWSENIYLHTFFLSLIPASMSALCSTTQARISHWVSKYKLEDKWHYISFWWCFVWWYAEGFFMYFFFMQNMYHSSKQKVDLRSHHSG